MKIFLLICLVAGVASADKLDRTYLPPPGSKFSGGSPGDIQVPLEFPKETYLTRQPRPQDGIPELELGINRRPKPVGRTQSSTQKPFSYIQNHVPKITTSYAITQTTTFAPPGDYHGLESSSFSNATGTSKQPQGAGQVYQQPNRGQFDNAYNQYQQGNQQSLIPYGSSTQQPLFQSNRKPVPYLPPTPSSYKEQSSFEVPSIQNGLGYLSGQPQGHSYQDGHQSSMFGQSINQPDFTSPQVNQPNQFVGNVNIPSSTAVTQYPEESFSSTTESDINQQGFESSVSTQQNLYQSPGLPGFPTPTAGSESQDKTRLTKPGLEEENQYLQSQNFPASTLASQYLHGQRIVSPGSNLQNQYSSSTTSPVYQDTKNVIKSGPEQHHLKQNQNYYPGNQNFPTSTAATQYQNRQQFTPPGSMKQNQYLGNQNMPSTATPQYQDGQRLAKPGAPQETIASNQQVFGSRIPNQKNINQYPGNRNFLPSTAAPEFQKGQQFTTPESEQSNQYFENQNIPSTSFPQYKDSQHIAMPGVSQKAPNHEVFGSRVPTQQSQNQGIQNFPSSTAIPQFIDRIGFTTPGSIQLSSSSSTTGSVPSHYITDQNVPTTRPHFQNGQRFNIPGNEEQFSNQQNQQHPSTVAPQYQSTFAPTTGSNQQGISSVNQYSSQPHYSQRFPPSTGSPQQFVTESQATNGNDGIQPIPGTISSSQPELSSQGIVSSSPDYNLATSSTTAGPFPTRGYSTTVSAFVYQERPERPQAASDRTAEILSYENVLTPEGYSYSYDTSNGIHVDETGIVGDGTKAQGGFSYTGDDGKVYSVFYSADENGFRPRGDHLPTPPPIPEAIQRVIEQANKDRDAEIFDDGSYNEEMYGYMKYDGKLTQPRQKNKTLSAKNGIDSESYQTSQRFGAQKKKQFVPKSENKTYFENTDQDISEEEQAENLKLDDGNMKMQEEVNRRISNKRPTSVKHMTVEDMKAKSMKRKNFNRRPVSDSQGGGISDDVLITGDSDDEEDLDNELDVVNYKDDPDSRTDFRGTNKYLPNPKKVNQFSQFNRQPVLPDNANQLAKETNKKRKPNVHKSQVQTTGYGDEEELIVEDHIRNSSRKNKTNKKDKDQPKIGPLGNTSNHEKSDDYYDNDYTDINSKSESDDEIQSMKTDRRNKSGNHQYENERLNKPKNSKNNEGDTKIARAEETGYQYNPPQKNFDLEGEIKFITRTSVTARPKPISQKGSQKNNIRPFMIPKMYEDEEVAIDEDVIESDNSGKPLRPLRPLPSQKGIYPTTGKGTGVYNDNVTPEVAKDGQFDSTRQPTRTTPSRRPYARPQSAPAPEHNKKDTIGQNELNTPIRTQNSYRAGGKVFNNTPNKGISNVDNDEFVSTTPLPHSGSNLNNEYQQPGQYQTSIKPTDSSGFFEENAPGNEAIERRPVTNSGSRFPSTTYRPNYTFGDRTSAPSDSISANGFGRPIPSTAPQIIGDISKNEPGNVENNFRPGVGRLGVTSAPTQGPGTYRGSTTATIGEDFSGPKHPQGFDPETGYYYK